MKEKKKIIERKLYRSVTVLIIQSTLLSFFYTLIFFFFNDTATTEIYTNLNTLSLHDALPISPVTFRNLVCRLLLVTGETARAHVCSSHIQKSRMPSSA